MEFPRQSYRLRPVARGPQWSLVPLDGTQAVLDYRGWSICLNDGLELPRDDRILGLRTQQLGRKTLGAKFGRNRSSGMASVSDWKVPASVQPRPEDYAYDLE